MILFWLLCVSLVLSGWAFRREIVTHLEDLRLHLFGARARVPRSLAAPSRKGRRRRGGPGGQRTSRVSPSPRHPWPTPQVRTRAGFGGRSGSDQPPGSR
jgi:hypothetical protein